MINFVDIGETAFYKRDYIRTLSLLRLVRSGEKLGASLLARSCTTLIRLSFDFDFRLQSATLKFDQGSSFITITSFLNGEIS